jgi:hypothetical protein
MYIDESEKVTELMNKKGLTYEWYFELLEWWTRKIFQGNC